MTYFRFDDYEGEYVSKLASEFQKARPFPHLVLDDFIKLRPNDILGAFPAADWPGWRKFRDTYQFAKVFCDDIGRIPPLLASMIQELSSPAFLTFLESVTGISGLIPDPYLEGGGLHCSGSGGVLAPHTDFHIYPRLNLYRRLNVLVYLNPGWQKSFGGCLEFYENGSDVPAKLVVPTWGTGVIFLTDDRSVHGFSTPITGEGRWRRSVALYYYTSQEAGHFSGDMDTHWRRHGEMTGGRRVRLRLYQALLFGSRSFSRIAHRVNPNLGARLTPR